MNRIINYVGWSGHGNLGDDTLLYINKKIFNDVRLIPSNTLQFSRITLFGGGTLFPHYLYVIHPSKYNYAFGVGVRNPIYWKRFRSLMIKRIKQFNFRFIGVRDFFSQKILKLIGVNSKVIGDPCLLLKPSQHDKIKKTRIAINVGSSGPSWHGNREHVFIEIAKFCIALKKEGYSPILIPFWRRKMRVINKISEITDTPIFKNWRNPEKVIDLISTCSVLVGEKLHSIIFSAAAFTPFISLVYRPKCKYFAEIMGFEEYCLNTENLSHKKLIIMLQNLLDNWNKKRNQLIKNVIKYRTILRESAEEIKKDIKNLPLDKWSVNSSQKIRCLLQGSIASKYVKFINMLSK